MRLVMMTLMIAFSFIHKIRHFTIAILMMPFHYHCYFCFPMMPLIPFCYILFPVLETLYDWAFCSLHCC